MHENGHNNEIKSSAADEPFITIVSGLPRSGTSMMMQMLDKGGMAVLTDKMRKADDSNPKGYYEFEKVKAIREDYSWLHEAAGKVVKIVSPLIPHLPDGFNYRIVFMERNLDEVLRSQRSMLERDGKNSNDIPDEKLKDAFEKQVRLSKDFLSSRNIKVIYVNHRNVLDDPQGEVQNVNAFLGGRLNELEMRRVVDPALYRERV